MTNVVVLALGGLGLALVARALAFYAAVDGLAVGLVVVMGASFVLGIVEQLRVARRAATLQSELAKMPRPANAEAIEAASPPLRALLQDRVAGFRSGLPAAAFTTYLLGFLVLLGLLGTFLGLFASLRGATAALGASADVATLRDELTRPLVGLARAFGTSATGIACSGALGLAAVFARREEQRFLAALGTYERVALAPLLPNARLLACLEQLASQGAALPTAAARLEDLVATVAKSDAERRRAEQEQAVAVQRVLEAGAARTAATLEAGLAGAVTALEKTTERAASALETTARSTGEALAATTTKVSDALEGTARKAADALEAAAAQSSEALKQASTETVGALGLAASQSAQALASATSAAATALETTAAQTSAALQATAAQASAAADATTARAASALTTTAERTAAALEASSARATDALDASTARTREALSSLAQEIRSTLEATTDRVAGDLLARAADADARAEARQLELGAKLTELVVAGADRSARALATSLDGVLADVVAKVGERLTSLAEQWESQAARIEAARERSEALYTKRLEDEATRATRWEARLDESLAGIIATAKDGLGGFRDAVGQVSQASAAAAETILASLRDAVAVLGEHKATTMAELTASHDGLLARLEATHVSTVTRLDEERNAALARLAEGQQTMLEGLAAAQGTLLTRLSEAQAEAAGRLADVEARAAAAVETELARMAAHLDEQARRQHAALEHGVRAFAEEAASQLRAATSKQEALAADLLHELGHRQAALAARVDQATQVAGKAAEAVQTSGVELNAVAAMFTAAVDRYREANEAWTTTLARMEKRLEGELRNDAAGLLEEHLERTREVFQQTLEFQRELFAELRALRGRRPPRSDEPLGYGEAE